MYLYSAIKIREKRCLSRVNVLVFSRCHKSEIDAVNTHDVSYDYHRKSQWLINILILHGWFWWGFFCLFDCFVVFCPFETTVQFCVSSKWPQGGTKDPPTSTQKLFKKQLLFLFFLLLLNDHE